MKIFKKKKTKIELLYDKYKFLLFKISKDILKRSELAKDIVHQVFVKIIENNLILGEIGSPKTRNLLAMMCRNLSINMHNKMKNKECMFDEIPNEKIQENKLVEEIAISNYNIDIIINSINDLPSIYRDVLLLEKVHGYTKEEISQIFEISIETVYKRSQRARKKLAQILKEKEIIEREIK